LFTDGPSFVNNSFQCSVFIRNLPDNIDYSYLKGLLKDDDLIGGIKIEKDTAEIDFLRKDAAQRAVDNLNGRSLMGKRIKAALISDLNAGTLKSNASTSNNSSNNNTLEIRKRESSYDNKRMQMEDEDDEDEDDSPQNRSIISRIKKNH